MTKSNPNHSMCCGHVAERERAAGCKAGDHKSCMKHDGQLKMAYWPELTESEAVTWDSTMQHNDEWKRFRNRGNESFVGESHPPALAKPVETKDTNPKDAIGIRKARWFSYIPLQVLVGVGLALMEGGRKYGKHNYRKAGVRASVYVDATVCGHLTPWMEGEDIDVKSGLNHIDKAIASLVVLRDGMLQGNWVDDRPIRAKGLDLEDADKKAGAIIDLIPNAKQPFTHLEHGDD